MFYKIAVNTALVIAEPLFLREIRDYFPESLWLPHFHQPINTYLVYVYSYLKISYVIYSVDSLQWNSPSAAL